ncbi:MGMT family protein [Streptomyces alanosinicus]|uniref:Methylated-DNA-[protein]-cysteine S-methyltransferase DNA binding domain-containing protein n=1 Tax=Streptomyces alanosinicus TaxID=68171 RepID=A0A918YTF6_9ACTN|nr:MGMT family protein [Streptomyces alanosinicus]GHE15597.1 hypothetical protein GCM10010339_90770 [Streptomyces alanosinicus]
MTGRDADGRAVRETVIRALRALAPASGPGFALDVLRRAGIAPERYDTYVREGTAAGALFVAFGRRGVTGAALRHSGLEAAGFEASYRARTGRSAVPTATPLPGLRSALRTGRVGQVPVETGGLGPLERAVLHAVREIPTGELRPIGWVVRQARLPELPVQAVLDVLGRNPVPVLIPCHRVTYDDGTPCDASCPPWAGDRLRAAEGLDMQLLEDFGRRGLRLLGCAVTRVCCHPTCARVRSVPVSLQQSFRTAQEARQAGFLLCPDCRPAAP